MAAAIRVFDVAGAGGINLNDSTNWRFHGGGLDWDDAKLHSVSFAETSQRDGGPLVNRYAHLREVKLVFSAPPGLAVATVEANWSALVRLCQYPPTTAEIGYKADSTGSQWSYLDIASGGELTCLDWGNKIFQLTVWCWPFWRTVALTAARILQNLLLNASFERWTAGTPDSWTGIGTPTSEDQSTVWAKYGLSSYHVVGTAVNQGRHQTVSGLAGSTTYAISVWVKRASGGLYCWVREGAPGYRNDVTVGTVTTGTGAVKLSVLYTTLSDQTSIQIFVVLYTGGGDGRFDGCYLALASNTKDPSSGGTGAVPTEWVSYTEDLYNHEDTQVGHVNGLYLADLLGDAPALAELRFNPTTQPAAADRIHLALREAYAQNHVFQYQAEVGSLNAAWPATLFDGGATASPETTIGSTVLLTAPGAPGTKDWTWACRVTLSPLGSEASTVWLYRRGRFRVLARVATDAGTATNWQIKGALVVGSTTTAYNDPVALSLNASVYHLVDLGEFVIPPGQPPDGFFLNPLRLEVAAKVTTEPSKLLYIDCLYLVDNGLLAQTMLASGAGTWAQGAWVYTTTLEDHQSKAAAKDSAANYVAAATDAGDPFYLPVAYPKTTQYATAYDTHTVLNWLLQRDAGGHVLTDRCALRISYIPQYLAPQG